jgi:hypothetical protein
VSLRSPGAPSPSKLGDTRENHPLPPRFARGDPFPQQAGGRSTLTDIIRHDQVADLVAGGGEDPTVDDLGQVVDEVEQTG